MGREAGGKVVGVSESPGLHEGDGDLFHLAAHDDFPAIQDDKGPETDGEGDEKD